MNTALRKYPRILASLLGGVLVVGAQNASAAADAAAAPEAAPAAAESDLVVAGVNPSQRGSGGAAPVISEVKKGDGWYNQALEGVSKPYPTSLSFLENQGNWYTPFTVPGMTGPYDIRGWHQ